MDAFISGAWRTPRRGEVLIGGAWRTVTRGEQYRSGAWKRIAAFIAPMSVTANNVEGSGNSSRPVAVTSDESVAIPNGGLAPYRYSWSILTGQATALTPAMARCAFRNAVGAGATSTSTARVTCTDALNTVRTADITITLTNGG